MNPATKILNRVLFALPLIAAIIFHAVALNRWAMSIPAIVMIAALVARERNLTMTSRRTYVAGAIGLIAGLIIPVSNVTSGVLPDILIGVSTSVLICIAVLNVAAEKLPITWISAWTLVALSASVPMTRVVSASLTVFLLVTFLVAAWQIGLLRFRTAAIMQLAGLLAVVALSTLAIAAAARRVDTVMLMSAHAMTINNAMQNATGLSKNITVSSQNSIRLSKRPVLDLSTQSGYLRTHVLDEFNGRQWSTSARLMAQTHSFETLDADNSLTDTLPQQRLEIVFLDDLGDALPAPAGTRRIEHAKSRITGGWILRGAPNSHSVAIFSNAVGQLPTETEPSNDDVLIPEELQSSLGPIAAELTAAAKTNLAKASAIETFFHQNFEYSLQTNLDGDAHPLVIMVQEHRPAYCVYFASAMTVMLRSQGIPARVVSGYAPSEINRLTGRVIVRDRDAHAWVEAWSPEQRRYVALDPTPTASRLQVIDHPEERGIVASIIAAVRSWIQRVYLAATKAPLQLLGVLIASRWSWMVMVIAIAVMIYFRRLRKRNSCFSNVETIKVDPALRRHYDLYVRSLQQAGITPQPWETDEEIIARIANSEAAEFSEAARDFVTFYQASRFGGEEFDENRKWSPIVRHKAESPFGPLPLTS